MSLYNALFGQNKDTLILLEILGVDRDYFNRFRDIELIKNGNIIRVFTRIGGSNRDYYKDNWEKIKNNFLYIKDYDDDFDNTYAYIEFNIPKNYKEVAKKIFKEEPISFRNKFEKALEEIDKPGTRFYQVQKEISNKIIKNINSGNSINIIDI